MPQHERPALPTAFAAFAANLKHLREKAGLSQTALERQMKQRGRKVSQKSVSNIERGEHDSQISNLAAIADHFGVPLWVMLTPGLDPELLRGDRLKRVSKLMHDYLAIADAERAHVENMASAFAAAPKKK